MRQLTDVLCREALIDPFERTAEKSLRQSGFTLIELSIVLVIVGLIIGGVLVGRDLIAAAEIRATISQLHSFQTAVNAFQDKYRCLPGDCGYATQLFGSNPIACTQQAVSDTPTSLTCDGNGDGVIGDDPQKQFEHMTFWQHLAAAGMIGGAYSGMVASVDAPQYVSARAGINAPAAKFSGMVWAADDQDSDWMQTLIHSYPQWLMDPNVPSGGILHLGFGGLYGLVSCQLAECAGITPQQAFALDTKLDDGRPGTGMVQPLASAYGVDGSARIYCTDIFLGATSETAIYRLTDNSKQCAMMFFKAF